MMNRRTFLKRFAATGAALAGISTAEELFIPFAEAVEVPKFSFAHISDLHLDVQGDSTWQYREKSVPLFIDALRQLGRLPKLNFVVFGGDQIHYGPNDKDSLAVFQNWTAHLNMPFYILLGNTEVSPVAGMSKLFKEDYIRAWTGRGLRPGNTSWAFDPVRNVRVIGFDCTVEGKPYGEASFPELKWLENELKANKSKKLIIIFTHHLLLPTTSQDTSSAWSFWMIRNHSRVRELIEKFPNVRMVVSGHHHVSKVETAGKITYVSDPAVVTYPCSFRAYSVTRDGINLKNISVGDKATVSRARELLESDPYARMYDAAAPQKVSAYSMGLTEKDRETTIKL
jgi:3',5'-cyclic AMP phosphodiesterase CpdA